MNLAAHDKTISLVRDTAEYFLQELFKRDRYPDIFIAIHSLADSSREILAIANDTGDLTGGLLKGI